MATSNNKKMRHSVWAAAYFVSDNSYIHVAAHGLMPREQILWLILKHAGDGLAPSGAAIESGLEIDRDQFDAWV
jgi:hypothetical protein